MEAIAGIMTFERGAAHHTINQFNQDPEIGLNVIKNGPMEMQPLHILSNGFGFGGQNSSVVFSKFE